MNTKKRTPLSSAMEEFVFGTKEAALLPTAPEIVSPAPTPTPSQTAETPPTPPTPEAALPIATPPQPEASAPEPVPAPSKESSLTHRLQAPDQEATVRFTVDGVADSWYESTFRLMLQNSLYLASSHFENLNSYPYSATPP